jgi:hypothetical protein
MAQVRTSWSLTAEARFRYRVTLCEICSGQSGNGAVFRFAPVSISPMLHTHHLLLADLTRNINGRSLGTFQEAMLFRKSVSTG